RTCSSRSVSIARAARSVRTSDVPRVADRKSASASAAGVTASARSSERARAKVTTAEISPESWKKVGRARSGMASSRARVSNRPLPRDLVERTLPIAMLSLALIAVPVLVLEPAGLPRLRGLEKELDDVTAENADSYREVERLRAEVRELR